MFVYNVCLFANTKYGFVVFFVAFGQPFMSFIFYIFISLLSKHGDIEFYCYFNKYFSWPMTLYLDFFISYIMINNNYIVMFILLML